MKILVVQNRMGIGDMVIFLPFIEAISRKFETPVTLLIKENTKATEFLKNNKFIKDIIFLDRESKKGKHSGLAGFFKLANEIKKNKFDKIFIFNSSLRFYLLSILCRIKEIYQYPLFQKKKKHIITAAQNFIKQTINEDIVSNPQISIENNEVINCKKKMNIDSNKINILLGIGGSGKTKRVPARTFSMFISSASQKYNCNFFLATGNDPDELNILNEIISDNKQKNCKPLNKFKISEILPIIKNCNLSVCNDSSFSHLSAALGVKTIVLMADTPLIYGNYSPKMFPIIPDGEDDVSHNTLGKDKINHRKIFELFEKIIFE